MDAGEAELEHAPRPFSQQLDDPRRARKRRERRQTSASVRSIHDEGATGKFLGVPYDWTRGRLGAVQVAPVEHQDRRIVLPRAFGWGYDFNFAEIARRLHLRG